MWNLRQPVSRSQSHFIATEQRKAQAEKSARMRDTGHSRNDDERLVSCLKPAKFHMYFLDTSMRFECCVILEHVSTPIVGNIARESYTWNIFVMWNLSCRSRHLEANTYLCVQVASMSSLFARFCTSKKHNVRHGHYVRQKLTSIFAI